MLLLGGLGLGAGPASAQPAIHPTAQPRTQPAAQQPSHLDVIEVSGLIDPVMVAFVRDALDEAEAGGAQALVIQLDSRGGVAARAAVDGLAFRLSHARVPVVAWVGPSGGHAYGAAFELLQAAALSGVAPGTRVGRSPDPLAGQGVAGSLGARQALRRGVVDIDAPTLGDFIVELHGRRVGGTQLSTARVVEGGRQPRREPTVAVRFSKPGLAGRLLHTVSSPGIAYLLLLVGLLLAVFEFFSVGVGLAAATAAGCLSLAAYGLAVLPVRPGGLALVLLGVFGFAVDVQVGAPRMWTVIGTAALVGGSLTLFSGLSVPLAVLVAGVAGTVLFMVAAMPTVVRSRFSTPTVGRQGMVGEVGRALGTLEPEGTVEVRGARWRARTNRATPVGEGDAVRVVAIDGIVLEVEPVEGAARTSRH